MQNCVHVVTVFIESGKELQIYLSNDCGVCVCVCACVCNLYMHRLSLEIHT